jgi:hypothetical protein
MIHLELGPNVIARICVTETGGVVLRIHLGDRETAVPAAAQLGPDLLEAPRRAAEIGVPRDVCGRRARRKARR